jgi:hypothetical protein
MPTEKRDIDARYMEWTESPDGQDAFASVYENYPEYNDPNSDDNAEAEVKLLEYFKDALDEAEEPELNEDEENTLIDIISAQLT